MNRKLKYALSALVLAGYGFAAFKNPALLPSYLEYATRTLQQMAAPAPSSAPASAPEATPAAKP